ILRSRSQHPIRLTQIFRTQIIDQCTNVALPQSSSIRLYGYKELKDLLTSNGFGKFKAYGSIEGERFELGSRRLILVCEKL
ncbi:MAG: hypothetical protein J0M18_20790, partial [Ignavibacteria bacterium]|nr:hypothetical protein [Ignavibacteria bacterium]